MKFSIIICTYNPDKRLIIRTIKSIINLVIKESLISEVLLINNNSDNNILEDEDVRDEIKKISTLRIINETNQGLVYARIKGFKESKGDWLIFVDDDNELEKNYLVKLEKAITDNKEVACWGPGHIKVEFIDGAPNFVMSHYKKIFQEKNISGCIKGNEKGWHSYYPTGSGLCINRTAFGNYEEAFKSENLTAVGRKGNELSSGEDAQIIWTIIKKNQFVGCSHEMKLVHMIVEKRCSSSYIIKLNFNLSYDYYKSYYESFNDKEIFNLKPTVATYFSTFLKAFLKAFPNLKVFLKIFKIDSAWLKGYSKFYKEYFQ